MNLKKGITLIFLANVINMVFSLVVNFLLPKYLTTEAYAQIKSFQLYTGYVGMLHLGYADGMYLKYGGKRLYEINSMDLQRDIGTMRSFQLAICIVCILFSVFTRDIVLIAASLVIVPLNMTSYYRSLFQAVGEFDQYARIMNLTAFSTFLVNVTLVALHVYSGYGYYLVLYVCIDVIVWGLLEWILGHKCALKCILAFDLKTFIRNISDGFLLMLGNASSMMLTGMDRWFIKVLMDDFAFAQYSFAVSVENMMSVAVTPISTTLYNYFCTHKDRESVVRLQGLIVLFSAIIVSSAFPAKWIIELFLPHYSSSVGVIFILFGAQIFYIIVRCIYTNLYKAQKRQKIYFTKLSVVLIFGFLVNAVLYLVFSIKESFAVGTLLSGVLWLIMCRRDFTDIPLGYKTNLFLLLTTVLFIFYGICFEAIVGFFLYLISVSLIARLLMVQEMHQILILGKESIARFIPTKKQ